MKTILVTGGAGFIGSHLIDKLLTLGFKVINVDNFNDFYNPLIKESNIKNHFSFGNKYELFRIDISNKFSLKKSLINHSIDAIVHLAARAGVRPSIENPYQYQVDNVLGTQNIIDLAQEKGVKNLVLASSSSVYGNNPKTPFSESDNVDHPISPYAATKKANELQAYTAHYLYNMNVIMLRFFTVFGPRQRPDLAIHKFAKFILQGKPIPFYGDGSTSRDYTYIDDIIQGIIHSLNYNNIHKNVYEVINLGNNNPVMLKDMLKTIENNLNIKAILNVQPIPKGDVKITFADISKAESLLGYKVTTSFDEGVKRFIDSINF
jgi:UDP-glucuronate 4-epimerase